MKYLILIWLTFGVVGYVRLFKKCYNGELLDTVIGLIVFAISGPIVFIGSYDEEFGED